MPRSGHNQIRVAVIGAGAAGLCAARHLSLEPNEFEFDLYEQQDDLGGTWRYTDQIGIDAYGLPIHSSMYENLRTNLPKEVMAFPGFPFPGCNGKSFVHHTDVQRYLKSYTETYQLYGFIQFNSLIENVQPVKQNGNDDVKWVVTIHNTLTHAEDTKTYDAVMVCNGHYSVPCVPKIEGLNSFMGLQIHSHDYRNNHKFKDQKVVVLGAGASGIDIAIEVASVANEVVLSHNLPLRNCPLPSNLIQEVGIQSVSEKSVSFLNGNMYDCDGIILCTGYLYTYPFLHPDCHMEIGDQHVRPLYKHLIHTEFPTLGIWAIPKQIVPFPIYDQQVLVFLKFLKGEITLPSKEDMDADAERDFQERLQRGMKPRHAHTMPGAFQWEYDDELAKLGKIPPLSESLRKLFRHVHAIRKQDVLNYKNYNFKIIDDETFVEIN